MTFHILGIIIPTDELIFFRLKPSTYGSSRLSIAQFTQPVIPKPLLVDLRWVSHIKTTAPMKTRSITPINHAPLVAYLTVGQWCPSFYTKIVGMGGRIPPPMYDGHASSNNFQPTTTLGPTISTIFQTTEQIRKNMLEKTNTHSLSKKIQ